MTAETIATPAPDTAKAPRAKTAPKAATPAAAAPKRAGRPAAPQTVGEAIDTFRTKVQAARRALNDARATLLRMPELEGGGGNWQHSGIIADMLRFMDFDLHSAQRTIEESPYQHPTDKI